MAGKGRRAIGLIAALATAALAACGQSVEDPREHQTYVIRGMATFEERLPIGNQAELVAQLLDATGGEGQERLISEYQLAPPGQFPFPIELSYAQTDVAEGAPLKVTVNLHENGVLLFSNEQALPNGRTHTVEVFEIALQPTAAGQERLDAWREERERAAQAEGMPPILDLDLDFDLEPPPPAQPPTQ